MSHLTSKLFVGSLVAVILLATASESWARYNTSAYRRYIQQQQQQYMMMMKVQQQAYMQAVAQQQAIEKHETEMRAKASKAAHDKELKHRQDLIAKRKAAQAEKAAGSSSTRTATTDAPASKPATTTDATDKK